MWMKKLAIIGASISLLVMTGCASKVYKAEAFDEPNRFAVVSVTGLTTGFGMSEKEEVELVTSVEKVVAKELKAAKGFRLIPSSKVLANRHYKAIKGESTDGLMTMKAAKGFKKFDIREQPEAMAKLRKDLKLTGVIQVAASFAKRSGGMWLSGILPIPIPVSAGSTHGEVTFSIVAFDSNNEIVWQDMIVTKTEGSVGTVMGVGNLSSLHPQLIDAAQVAANTAVRDLNAKVK